MRVSTATRSLECYLPRMLHEQLAHDAVRAGPLLADAHAAVLLSDLQGFTALVERFSRGGRAGLEELTWALNRYFADLVTIVSAHGGDVVSIAGDAFLCVWRAESAAALPSAVASAASAGLAIQEQLGRTDETRTLPLATRIGIGAGRASIATVGGTQGRWELLVSGPALQDAVRSEASGRPGQVVIAESAWRHVQDRAQALRLSEQVLVLEQITPVAPTPATEREPLPPDTLHAHVPPAVLDRLQTPSTTWLAESRAVTVLFTSIPPLAEIDDSRTEALASTQAIVSAFHEIVARFEGTAKVDIDGKGTLLLATWGLPPRSHEDDAVRAVRAAFDLRKVIGVRALPVGIGVATGRVICGAFGSDARRDYMVRGDVINLAARLMAVAREPGSDGVTCDDATRIATRGGIRFEPMPAVSVKGREAPVRIFRPVSRRDRTEAAMAPIGEQERSRTVGRHAERAALAAAWHAMRDRGTGSVRVIEGDAGLGKSMLVDELARIAHAEGAQVLRVTADAIDRTTPYFAWRPLFTELLGLSQEFDVETLNATKPSLTTGSRRKASSLLGRLDVPAGMERLRPLLSSVLPVPFPDNELTAEMTGDVRADNTRRLLVALLQRAVRDQTHAARGRGPALARFRLRRAAARRGARRATAAHRGHHAAGHGGAHRGRPHVVAPARASRHERHATRAARGCRDRRARGPAARRAGGTGGAVRVRARPRGRASVLLRGTRAGDARQRRRDGAGRRVHHG